jgi:hypothetical protein
MQRAFCLTATVIVTLATQAMPARAQFYSGYGPFVGGWGEMGYDNYLYRGLGYYNFAPPAIANPKVIIPSRAITSLPGITGRVVALNERQQLITLRLPAETVEVPYGPLTQFRAADGDFPEITPGILINVSRNMITVIGSRTGDQAASGRTSGSSTATSETRIRRR